jgi:hypothetical protein
MPTRITHALIRPPHRSAEVAARVTSRDTAGNVRVGTRLIMPTYMTVRNKRDRTPDLRGGLRGLGDGGLLGWLAADRQPDHERGPFAYLSLERQ